MALLCQAIVFGLLPDNHMCLPALCNGQCTSWFIDRLVQAVVLVLLVGAEVLYKVHQQAAEVL
jgi:hypothetical protein